MIIVSEINFYGIVRVIKIWFVFFYNYNLFFKIECFFYMYLEFIFDVFFFIYLINLNLEIICNV